MDLILKIRARKITELLGLVVLGFMGACILGHSLKYWFDQPWLFPWVNMDAEKNLPAAFSCLLLITASVLLLLIAWVKHAQRDSYRFHWTGLSLVFGLLAVDEWMSFHERMNDVVRSILPTGGVFHFAWVIAGITFVLIMGGLYWTFLWQLPKQYRRLFLMAAGFYLGGAIGMEMVSGYYADTHQTWIGTIWLLLTTFEEALEMIGAITFIYALLLYIQETVGELKLRFI